MFTPKVATNTLDTHLRYHKKVQRRIRINKGPAVLGALRRRFSAESE